MCSTKEVKVLHQQLTTPDGTVLVSGHRHDFKTYLDKNGKTYMIDGGTAYLRCSCNGDEKFFTVNSDDEFDVIREHLSWGTYGKCGTEELKYIKLKDITNDHLEALLDYLSLSDDMYTYMKKEQEFRSECR